jgi:GT2 family glycosyltransferase
MKKEISVVIVTYNRLKDAEETIESIINQSIKPSEIIVIDNGSDPPFKMKSSTRNLKLIRFSKEVGTSNSRNYGASIANGEYLALIDDDAIADKNWLEEIQEGIKTGADILGGPLKPIFEVPPPKWWNEKDFGGVAAVGNINEIWGANMIIKKEVFRKIGFFNPEIDRRKGKLLNNEETDWIDRARRRGHYILFMPKTVVYHKVKSYRMTLKYILKWWYYWGKSLKMKNGYRSSDESQGSFLKSGVNIFKNMLSLVNPFIIFSEKSVRIKKIAWIMSMLGRLP